MMTKAATVLSLPDFSLPTSTGETVCLDDIRGENAITVVFVPELRPALSDIRRLESARSELADAGADLVVVVDSTVEAASDFAARHNVTSPLLCDVTHDFARNLNLQLAGHPVVLLVDRKARITESVAFPHAQIGGIIDRIRRIPPER